MSFSGIKMRQLSGCLFLMVRSTSGFVPNAGMRAASTTTSGLTGPLGTNACLSSSTTSAPKASLVQRHMSTGASEAPPIRHINKEEMKQILMEHEEMVQADLESPYFVLDVRTEPEVMQTGKLSPSVPTLPVQVMMPPYNALQMDEEEFEESFGFSKPPKDVTMVFSCAAGIRSVSACKLAQQAGYANCVNYMGGASEWFYS